MKKNVLVSIPALVATACFAFAAVGCANPCKDLEAKKADCAKAGEAGKAICEMGIDTVVKAGNKDACKATLDGLNASMPAAK
ncbi:MAG: hypothetical protein IV100_09470 [Myxococcales bacterium]|nr:hypothetical protein [Myxococcales bacterium]